MHVNFVMLSTGRTGGHRVIFELANALSKRGYRVSITALGGDHRWFPLNVDVNHVANIEIAEIPNRVLRKIRSYVPLGGINLLSLDYLIRRLRLPAKIDLVEPLSRNLPDSDVAVATFYPTAFAVHRHQGATGAYFLQHYEPLWSSDTYRNREIVETYSLPLHKIVNSSWLRKIMNTRHRCDALGPVTPGVDQSIFYERDLPKKEAKTILSLGKATPWKGLNDLFEALSLIRQDIPKLRLVLYGSESGTARMSPVPCEYVAYPSDYVLATMYCRADVVVIPSWFESSPLPPLEAMACGTPVVTTRFGTEDYCVDGKNSLVVEPRNSVALAEAIQRVLTDQDLAESLRKSGIETSRIFTWEQAAAKFEKTLKELR